MPAADLELLVTAARESGEIARKFWRDAPQVWDKGGDDPVSEADLAVDTHLKQRLLAARPGYGWVSEETEDDLARLEAECVFIVDPIDGTRAFVAGEKTWAHSLAVSQHGQITAAVVFLPVHDKMYVASIGGGATLNDVKITASQREELTGATVISPKINLQPQFWKNNPPQLIRHFRPSLAYRLSLVAEGRFDSMLTFHPAWEWDIAAGALIAAEAGAHVSDKRAKPLSFNQPTRQSAGVVVTGPNLHAKLVSQIKEQ